MFAAQKLIQNQTKKQCFLFFSHIRTVLQRPSIRRLRSWRRGGGNYLIINGLRKSVTSFLSIQPDAFSCNASGFLCPGIDEPWLCSFEYGCGFFVLPLTYLINLLI